MNGVQRRIVSQIRSSSVIIIEEKDTGDTVALKLNPNILVVIERDGRMTTTTFKRDRRGSS